jgi:hypothetical protein
MQEKLAHEPAVEFELRIFVLPWINFIFRPCRMLETQKKSSDKTPKYLSTAGGDISIAKRKMMDGMERLQLQHGNTAAQAKYNQMLSWFAKKSQWKPTDRPNTIDPMMNK